MRPIIISGEYRDQYQSNQPWVCDEVSIENNTSKYCNQRHMLQPPLTCEKGIMNYETYINYLQSISIRREDASL